MTRIAIVSPPGAIGLAASVHRGMEVLGFEARRVIYPSIRPAFNQLCVRGAGAAQLAFESITRPWSELALITTLARHKPELVLFIKCDDLHRTTYAAIKRLTGGITAAFHPDDPFNTRDFLRALAKPSHRRALTQIQAVDHYFIWSPTLVQRCGKLTDNEVSYLTFACDPELHGRPDGATVCDASLAADVTFIGAWGPKREQLLSAVIDKGFDVAIWGPFRWRTHCKTLSVTKAWRGRGLYSAQQVSAVRSSKININILRAQNESATNQRTFEIPCASGFMLHEWSDASDSIFPDGKAAAYFYNSEHLCEQISRYLDDDELRHQVASAGRAIAMEHTYVDWCRALVEQVGITDS